MTNKLIKAKKSISSVMSLKKIIDIINKNRSFLITSHVGLEGDALGSELALALLLKSMNKSVFIVNEDNVPKNYVFLTHFTEIKNDKNLIRPLGDLLKDKNCRVDAAFILDCSDFSRCGKVSKVIPKDLFLAAIDHHISNLKFADVNWVEPKASSTGEMIYKLYKAVGAPFSHASALSLYTAILTDTGSFKYSNTSYYTHTAAAELIKFDISANKIYQDIYESNSCADIVVLKEALDSFRIDKKGKIGWFRLNGDFSDAQADQTDSILDFARRIKEIEACFLLKKSKSKNDVRVNLRSRGKVDVSKVAHSLGGGGHKNASGCTIRGTMDDAEKLVLEKLKKEIY